MLKNKTIATLLVIFLVFSFYGNGILSNIVLCIDSCGHVALEPFHYSPHYSNLTSESDNIHCHSISQTTFKESDCSSCSDIPVAINFLDQNIPTVRYKPDKTKIQSLSTKDSALYLYKRPLDKGFLTELTSSLTSTLTSLKTTILIV